VRSYYELRYARVSTEDQHTANQLTELRRYVEARGWAATAEHVDY
jgi:DNA invertase Pin-like site-specific DNA recombinase